MARQRFRGFLNCFEEGWCAQDLERVITDPQTYNKAIKQRYLRCYALLVRLFPFPADYRISTPLRFEVGKGSILD